MPYLYVLYIIYIEEGRRILLYIIYCRVPAYWCCFSDTLHWKAKGNSVFNTSYFCFPKEPTNIVRFWERERNNKKQIKKHLCKEMLFFYVYSTILFNLSYSITFQCEESFLASLSICSRL